MMSINKKIDDELKLAIKNLRHIALNYPEQLIGSQVYIYWEEYDLWYRAQIKKYMQRSGKFMVIYDEDSYTEWLNL